MNNETVDPAQSLDDHLFMTVNFTYRVFHYVVCLLHALQLSDTLENNASSLDYKRQDSRAGVRVVK